jgi:hypothetical protein
MIRQVAAGLILAALFAGGIRLPILRLLLPPHRPPDVPAPIGAIDRKPLRFANDPTPADVLQFFERVRAETKEGERVALKMAWPHDGWSYAYWRASYILSGRFVVAPTLPVEETAPAVVALWRTGWGDPHYEIVFVDANSAILRRKR